MKLIVRAVAYPRYSSDNQREESISAQLKAIEQYCLQKGYVLVNVYPDEEKTATTDRRPNFQKMIEDSHKRLFDVVVVHKLDRFARNRYDSAHYKRILKRNGVRVESVLEQLDNSPESVVLESVLEGMAEYYSLNLAREVKKGMQENADKGTHTGGKAPYGLKVNPVTRKLEIDERTYKAVQIYFKSIDAGMSNQDIANKLNKLGYRTQKGREFTTHSFCGWATNRKYRGDYVFNVASAKDEEGRRNNNKKKPIEEQTIIPGAVPAIIDADLWDRVNKKFKARKFAPGRMKAKVNYLLTGKIYCGNCGALYSGNSYTNTKSKDRNVLTYYKCQNKCGNTSVRKEDLEEIVIKELINNCFSEDGTKQIVERIQRLYMEERMQAHNNVEPIKKELAEIEAKLKNWVIALGAGVMSVVDEIKHAEQRKEALEFELNKAMAIENTNVLDESLILNVLNSKKNSLLYAEEDEKKQVLQEYVDQVIIQNSRDINNYEVEITYRVFNGGGEGSRTPVRR